MKFFRLPVIIGALPVTLQNGTTADATQVMADLNWIVNQVNANAAALATVALINVNNNFTVVQSGQAATQPANFPIASQVQNNVFNTLSSNLGTNTITARIAALPLLAYAVGQVFTFLPTQPNTGSVTLNIDSLGSAVIRSSGRQLVGGELGSSAVIVRMSTLIGQPAFDLINPLHPEFAQINLSQEKNLLGTTVDFTGIPSWAKQVVINIVAGSTDGTSALLLQLGDAGGIENAGYISTVTQINNAISPSVGASGGTGFQITFDTAAVAVYRGAIILTLENAVTNAWTCTSNLGRSDTTTIEMQAGAKLLSQPLTQIRLTTVSGGPSYDAGVASILISG